MPGSIDHLLIAVIAVMYPIYEILDWHLRTLPQLKTGESRIRLRVYREAIIEQWRPG